MTQKEEEWAELVDEWRASGLSTGRFANKRGVSPYGLKYWSDKLNRRREPIAAEPKSGSSEAVRILPVVRAGGASVETSSRSVSIAAEKASPSVVVQMGSVRIEVHRGFDHGLLREVMSVLREQP